MIKRTDIINNLISKYGFKSYLEIGVEDPAKNFDKINCELKHSLDPAPLGSCTFITTSDNFFQNIVGGQKYDIIFVDGLHTSDQAYKDVMNSIKHLNEDGFIIMHDCNPTSEFNVRPYSDFLQTKEYEWNGDVYKSFIFLKHQLTDWTCFVVDEDFGCGILTKRKINIERTKPFNTYGIIYKYFNENRKELLQLISYDEFLNI